jgi:hypothetical protein
VERAAWHRGDRHTLAAQVASVLPLVWELTRGGFLRSREGRLHVRGVADGDRAERLVASIVAAALTPQVRRAHAPDSREWRALLLAELRDRLEEEGRVHGGLVSLSEDDEPPSRPDLDRPDFTPDNLAGHLGVDERARAEALVACAATLPLDADDVALVEHRWRRGEPCEAVGRALGTSRRRVAARERVIRRHLRHHAARHGLSASAADLDAALAGDAQTHVLPLPTRERITLATLTRVDPSEPRPLSARLPYAVGALGLGLGLGLAMYLGLIPGPADDRTVTPTVALSCSGPCTAGARAQVTGSAPRKTRRVAVGLVHGGQATWLTASVLVPSAARLGPAPLMTEDLVLPADLPSPGPDAQVVAVYSKKRLDRAELDRVAQGQVVEGAHVAWSTLGRP